MKIVKGTFYKTRYSYDKGFIARPVYGYIINDEVGIFQERWGSYNPVDIKSGLSFVCAQYFHEYYFRGRQFMNLLNTYKYYLEMKGRLGDTCITPLGMYKEACEAVEKAKRGGED